MSFANVLKQQLLHLRYEELGELYARTHGLLRFSKAFGPQKMLLQTENKSVAELYADSIFGLIGIGATKASSVLLWTIKTIGKRSCAFLAMGKRLYRL